MRKSYSILILFFCLCITFLDVQAEEIKLNAQPKQEVHLKEKLKEEKKSLTINNPEAIKNLIDNQQEQDLKDLDLLWTETVNKNQVIKFALKKLSVPESQHRIHSSFMQKSVNAMISGVSFIPSLLGANYSVQSGAFAAGRLAHSLINKDKMPQEIPMTDTEVIELAGMIENLQNDIIKAYYAYKSSLMEIKEIRARIVLYNKNYSDAIQQGNVLEIIVSSSLFDEMSLEEMAAIEKSKKYQLELQRLAGKSTVEKLSLYQASIEENLLNQVFIKKEESKK